MKDRYDRAPGKESSIAKTRHARHESVHNANNAFVKRTQAAIAPMGGKAPRLEGKYMEFNANMVNNGGHAQDLASKLTSDIDHKAFPVK